MCSCAMNFVQDVVQKVQCFSSETSAIVISMAIVMMMTAINYAQYLHMSVPFLGVTAV